MKISSSIIVVFCYFIVLSCSFQENKWENAKRKKTIDSFEEYIKEYPTGVHVAESRHYIDSIEFSVASKQIDDALLKQYMKKYPQSENIEKAKTLYELVAIPFKIDCEFGSAQLHGQSTVSTGDYYVRESHFDPPATINGEIKSMKINGITVELSNYKITESIIQTKEFGDIKYVCTDISKEGAYNFASFSNQFQINKILMKIILHRP
jgi:hypothetical protein